MLRSLRRLLSAAVGALPLAACRNPPGGASGATAAFVPAPGGPLVARDSGFVFPEKLGGFGRVNPRQYNASGTDVSVGYNQLLPPVAVTIYVYPAEGRTLAQEFARRQAEVKGVHPAARLLSQGAAMVSPTREPAQVAEYAYPDTFARTYQPVRSELLVARRGERFVEYRITYAAPSEAVAAPRARRFVQTYAWP